MKKFLYVIIALLVVYIILAFFGPKEIKIERSISINKPAATVLAKLGDFKYFHDEWSSWTEKDPEMKTTYKGNPGEVGAFYSWDGNKQVGMGEMEIKSITKDSLIERVKFGNHGDSKAYFVLTDKGISTDVSWTMLMNIGFMARPIMLFMNMDKMVAPDFEKSLANLKTKLESIKDEISTSANHEVKEVRWDEKTFYGTKKLKMSGSKLKEFLTENWPKIQAEMDKEKITSPMSACGLFYSWDQKTMQTDCAAAMCVPNGKQLKGFEKYLLPASRVLSVPYYGAPENSIEAHFAVDAYMKERKLDYSFVIEEYVINASLEKDTTKWLTNIYYIIK